MIYPITVIPEKISFNISEVCDLVGVQSHVLRYWETEFPMLSPQRNSSGQRAYRRRDVEIALRIKELLYDELFTVPGAKRKLQSELRGAKQFDTSSSQIIQRDLETGAILRGSYVGAVVIYERKFGPKIFKRQKALKNDKVL